MATPLGTNVINSLSSRYIMPMVTDNVYGSNLMLWRLLQLNKKVLQGGLHIEIPLDYAEITNGAWYQGFEPWDIVPADTVKNAAYDWKQAVVPVSVDGFTLIRADSPDAIVNFLTFYFEKAQMQMCELLGDGIWNTGSNAKAIDGLEGAVDDGGVLATYGGLLRSSNTWWNCQDDASTATLTVDAMRTHLGNVTSGGRTCTIIVGTQANYNRFWSLSPIDNQRFMSDGARNTQLANAGFTNLLFDGIPFCVDSHVPANHIFFLNEDYIHLYVNPREDFTMRDFIEPVNQNAMTSVIKWTGNLCLSNVARQGKMSVLTA